MRAPSRTVPVDRSSPSVTSQLNRSRSVPGVKPHEPGAHQVDEVAAVEALLRAFIEARDARLEPAERIPTPLDVRPVGGEEAHLLARLLDDPPDRLVGVGRHPDLAAAVL